MKIITWATLAITLPLLTACVVDQPYNEPAYRNGYNGGYYAPRPIAVHVDDHNDWDHNDRDRDDWDHDDHDRRDWDRGRGYHCPPGQAKKGNC